MAKFKSRLPLWFFVTTIGATFVNAYFAIRRMTADGSGGPMVELVSITILAAVFANGIRNRLVRPVVEIGDDFITYGSVFQAIMSKARLSDVAEIVPSSPRRVVLRMRSGRKRRISLFEVAIADRDAARQAIGDAVARSLG